MKTHNTDKYDKVERLENRLWRIKTAFKAINVGFRYYFNKEKEVYSYVLYSARTEQYDDIANALLIIDFDNLNWLFDDINNELDDYAEDLEKLGYVVDNLKLKEEAHV